MSKRDYYDVLGVEKGADDKAIKSAFRKLAMANHPCLEISKRGRLAVSPDSFHALEET